MDSGSLFGVADEPECGILGYVDPDLRGIGGVLKTFPEDFRVREAPLPLTPGTDSLPECEHGFIKFTLHKRGVDTLEALEALAAACSTSSKHFGFAGIKDSWAVTTQEITVARSLVTEEMLVEAAQGLPQLRLSDFRTCAAPLVPGALVGNRFLLRVRMVSVSARRLRNAVRSLRRRGFVNYVGMQRFGKAGVRSDHVGLAYLQGNYERCLELLLHKNESLEGVGFCSAGVASGRGRTRKWAEAFERTSSAACALKAMPPVGLWAERRLLGVIKKIQERESTNTVAQPLVAACRAGAWCRLAREAFLSLPHSLRVLYLHAYVDRLWNLGATERLARYGLDGPVEGDVVGDQLVPSSARLVGSGDHRGATLFDVLLPRPGMGATLPTNSVGSLMRSYLEYEGLTPETLCVEASCAGAERYLHGAYRPVVSRPRRLRWGVEWPEDARQARRGTRTVLLDFLLTRGQYATMAMRELMRKRPPRKPKRHIVFSESESDDA